MLKVSKQDTQPFQRRGTGAKEHALRKDSARILAMLDGGIKCFCTRSLACSNESCAFRERSCNSSIGRFPNASENDRPKTFADLTTAIILLHNPRPHPSVHLVAKASKTCVHEINIR